MAATLISYDWIITLDKESEHIWRYLMIVASSAGTPSYYTFAASKKWTLPNSLCIVARYFGLAFILFIMIFVSMSSVREVNLDFFASVATQGHWFIRLCEEGLFILWIACISAIYSHQFTSMTQPTGQLLDVFPLTYRKALTIISMTIILMSVANPGVTAVMITFIPLLYQIALRRASLGIKALP
ncbi:hypothetical protein BU17DRAFT_63666 [Hysterangium stoloniferum]|nr:hypothetical protein BU17DRAFT_63666 [Hysterangium stoloniferum]